MQSKNFNRIRGVIQQGIWGSLFRKDIGVQDQLDVLIGQGKFLLGHWRLLHHLSCETFSNLHVFVRPGTVAAAQVNLHLANQQKNISVVVAFSHAISIPSVSGPSYQVCWYHIDRLLSDPTQVLRISSPRELMAISRSMSAFTDYSICNLTLRHAQPRVAAYRSFNFYSRGSFENCRKTTMRLMNKEQSNNFLLYRYFMYNAVKRKGPNNPFLGFEFEGFYTSSPTYSSADRAPEVSFDHPVKEEVQSRYSDSSDMNIPIDRTLKLNSASCYLPHPDKEETGGEDAHFICPDEQAIGVADGVGGWADLGVDAGQYARELMSNAVNAIHEEPRGSTDPSRVLEKAYTSTNSNGSSTACIIALTDRGLNAVNLGDSGFMVVRDRCTKSPVQQHDFNFTYQLESGNSGNLLRSGQVFTVPIAPGDIVIAGTDGLFDNLYNS